VTLWVMFCESAENRMEQPCKLICAEYPDDATATNQCLNQ